MPIAACSFGAGRTLRVIERPAVPSLPLNVKFFCASMLLAEVHGFHAPAACGVSR
jgi:hypothetical protein